jgi:hypothetical protein
LKGALRTGSEIRFKNMEVSVGGSFSVKLVDLGYPAPAGAEVRRLVEENSAGYVAAVYEKAAYVKTRDDDLVMFTSEPATPYCVLGVGGIC